MLLFLDLLETVFVLPPRRPLQRIVLFSIITFSSDNPPISDPNVAGYRFMFLVQSWLLLILYSRRT